MNHRMIFKKAWEWLIAIVAIYFIMFWLGSVLMTVGFFLYEMYKGNKNAWIVFSMVIFIIISGIVYTFIKIYREYKEDAKDPFADIFSWPDEKVKQNANTTQHSLNADHKEPPVQLTKDGLADKVVKQFEAKGHDPKEIREMIKAYGF
ncbi:hypothetical protein Q4E40_18165 [Pontibacter sp. BT731]|uniref:hypothetical protein n=1 Tax=Pontibacter coccineus TaxID=3063328 RepID=UPI0026E133BA|nr:hypothetical protein [Pontibacter sp. BT731]MDO6392066.1 hypothetical protein [Pontibacter sp. BT731]